jgi:hypothetical protein
METRQTLAQTLSTTNTNTKLVAMLLMLVMVLHCCYSCNEVVDTHQNWFYWQAMAAVVLHCLSHRNQSAN